MKYFLLIVFLGLSHFAFTQSSQSTSATNKKTSIAKQRLASPLIFQDNGDGTKTATPVSKKEFVQITKKEDKASTRIVKTKSDGAVIIEEEMKKTEKGKKITNIKDSSSGEN